MAKKTSSRVRPVVTIAVVLALAALSWIGWSWLDGVVVRQVVVHGHRHAAAAEVLAVARVDTGVRLLDVDPEVIADRASRHPWVRTADVRRLPSGTVRIDVEERTPVVLALDAGGRPGAYLDRDGYPMPLVAGAVYDVPLLRDLRLPPNPTQPLDSVPVVELLGAIGEIDPTLDALISSFEVESGGEITLHTAPAGSQGSIAVRLGQRDYAEKFDRLLAFWTQAVLSRPEKLFETIDLRFDGQIVTQES